MLHRSLNMHQLFGNPGLWVVPRRQRSRSLEWQRSLRSRSSIRSFEFFASFVLPQILGLWRHVDVHVWNADELYAMLHVGHQRVCWHLRLVQCDATVFFRASQWPIWTGEMLVRMGFWPVSQPVCCRRLVLQQCRWLFLFCLHRGFDRLFLVC